MLEVLNDTHKVFAEQVKFFRTGKTKEIKYRLIQLKALQKAIKHYENELVDAIKKDFGKPEFEAKGELALVNEEIALFLNNISLWAEHQKVKTNLVTTPGSSYTVAEPHGVVLVIGAWNYPFLLNLGPLACAIAAGNTTIIKPSELTPPCSAVRSKMLAKTFDPKYITAVEGNAETAQELLEKPFNFICFTGSIAVGKIVMQAAAQNLTPVLLELGGKSPVIVDRDCDLNATAKRIVWGKFLNSGQTCIAPDFIYVHKAIEKPLIEALITQIQKFYGPNPESNPDYSKIISQRHFNRLQELILQAGNIAYGGNCIAQSNYISPTILTNINWSDDIMQEEIFGPLLPILPFDHIDQAIETLQSKPRPLSLYVFSNSRVTQQKVMNTLDFGGGCINDIASQFLNQNLPFGGTGSSGMGRYHGKAGFETFSYIKSVYKKSSLIDIPLRYAPYTDLQSKIVKKIL